MDLRPALLAIALVSFPLSAHAQTPTPSDAPATQGVDGAPLARSVDLARTGVHATPAEALASGLSVVDEQRVDVDGDGDLDALVLVDLADSADEPKPDSGRGVAVVFHERHGWRAETVASVSLLPMEAGYNWGRVDQLRVGEAPLLHVLFSQAGPAGGRQADTVLHFERGALRAVYERSVESTRGAGAAAVSRALDVEARDLDGDGTSELLERVTERGRCAGAACGGHHGRTLATVARRVLRWDAHRRAFVAMNTAPRAARAPSRTPLRSPAAAEALAARIEPASAAP